ncbi:hypothetical protein ACROSR_17225 [Roseovarius tibetensis]|uniref:hypothetical protein n=1 Tax=Roseovarius tibetensis TaxID=2685897 RepID=UPI003D7FEC41
MTGDVTLRKSTAFVVAGLETDGKSGVRKATAHVVEGLQTEGKSGLRKSTAHVVAGLATDMSSAIRQASGHALVRDISDLSGDMFGFNDRPVYRAGTVLPFLDFGGGAQFGVTIPQAQAGTWTRMIYRPDDTFVEDVIVLSAGVNALGLSGHVNQVMLFPGALDSATRDHIHAVARNRAGMG